MTESNGVWIDGLWKRVFLTEELRKELVVNKQVFIQEMVKAGYSEVQAIQEWRQRIEDMIADMDATMDAITQAGSNQGDGK